MDVKVKPDDDEPTENRRVNALILDGGIRVHLATKALIGRKRNVIFRSTIAGVFFRPAFAGAIYTTCCRTSTVVNHFDWE
jgi:hypothetical protein